MRQVDGGLAAELHQRCRRADVGPGRGGVAAVGGRFVFAHFVFDNVAHRFLVQRLEIEPVAGVKVGGYGFGVGIDHNAFDAGFGEGDGGVDAAIVEFDALPDADGAAAYH